MQYSSVLLSFGMIATALAAPPEAAGHHMPVAREIYQFPNATPIENIALTRHGELLLSTLSLGRVYALNPDDASPSPRLVAELPDVDAVAGIAEVLPDVFAVNAGRINPTHNGFVTGSVAVYTIDLRRGIDKATVRLVARFPEAGTLNGMAALPARPGTVLTADSSSGTIYRVDTRSGAVSTAITDPLLTRGSAPDAPLLGVNGIRIDGDQLYFTNTAQGLFGKVKITPSGEKAGSAQIITTFQDASAPNRVFDDFILDGCGNAYACLQPDTLLRISPAGTKVVAAGGQGQTLLDDPTSAVFDKKKQRLFISTQGASKGYKGSVVEVSQL